MCEICFDSFQLNQRSPGNCRDFFPPLRLSWLHGIDALDRSNPTHLLRCNWNWWRENIEESVHRVTRSIYVNTAPSISWKHFSVSLFQKPTENLVILHFLLASSVHLVRVSFHFFVRCDAFVYDETWRELTRRPTARITPVQTHTYRILYAIFWPRWHNE